MIYQKVKFTQQIESLSSSGPCVNIFPFLLGMHLLEHGAAVGRLNVYAFLPLCDPYCGVHRALQGVVCPIMFQIVGVGDPVCTTPFRAEGGQGVLLQGDIWMGSNVRYELGDQPREVSLVEGLLPYLDGAGLPQEVPELLRVTLCSFSAPWS